MADCYDNRVDKIHRNEELIGCPVEESYACASVATNVPKMRGNLLLMWDEQDSNVDAASTAQVVNALISIGKDFDLLNAPGVEDAVGRSTGSIDDVQRRQYDFFVCRLSAAQTSLRNSEDAR